jgi:hypothetical protein
MLTAHQTKAKLLAAFSDHRPDVWTRDRSIGFRIAPFGRRPIRLDRIHPDVARDEVLLNQLVDDIREWRNLNDREPRTPTSP